MPAKSVATAVVFVMLAVPMYGANNSNNYTYLALGDSITFGYDPTVTLPATADKFTGYPEIVAGVERRHEMNASCPGQTSASFLDPSVPDIGCQLFKSVVPLHTSYTGSQMNFAVSQLSSNKYINLVTLNIGGDDLLVLEQQCLATSSFATCVETYLPGVLTAYAQNLTQILTGIRKTANYGGKLILVKYYSPSADPLYTATVAALNQVMVQFATPFGAKFADGFTAFQIASALYGGDPCKAGLLIRLSSTTCDVHPSPAGRDILAATVVVAQAIN